MEDRLEVDTSHAAVPLSTKVPAKKEFLRKVAKATAAPSHFRVRLGSIHCSLRVFGLDAAGESFLRRHLSRFLDDGSESTVFTIEYHVAPGALADSREDFWSDQDYHFHTWEEPGGALGVAHRDFVGRFDFAGDVFTVFGPRLCADGSDSVDNALQFAVNYYLPKFGTLLVHAATVERNGEAFLFYADSGTGKSTLANFCSRELGLRVLSGDQVYVSIDPATNRLYAHSCPISIADLDRTSPLWCVEPRPIRAMIHLVQRRRGLEYAPLTPRQALPKFLRQVFSRNEFSQEGRVLDLAVEFLSSPNVQLGEMSYPRGVSFWDFLEEQWKKTTS